VVAIRAPQGFGLVFFNSLVHGQHHSKKNKRQQPAAPDVIKNKISFTTSPDTIVIPQKWSSRDVVPLKKV
jgi:hypothetical protein